VGTLTRIAFRNLNRQKKRSYLLGGAIAFGIMIVTIINGFAGAFQANVAGNMAQLFAGHVFIEGVEKTPSGKLVEVTRDEAPIEAALTDAGIDPDTVAKRSTANVTLVFAGKKTTQSVWGVDFDLEKELKNRLLLKEGSFEGLKEHNALILSEGVAKKMKAQVGDRILVQLKTVTGQQNVGEFILAGISQDMGLFSSMVAYTHRAYLNELLDLEPNEYQWFGVMVGNLAKAETVSNKILDSLEKQAPVFRSEAPKPGEKAQVGQSRYQKLMKLAKDGTWEGTKFMVFTINDMISQVEELVSVLNSVSTVILAVLFLIIMVGITNTFRIIMYERIKEIGTMRALGMQRPAVRKLFLLEAGFLSTGGTVAGMLVAGIIMTILSLFNFGTDTVFALMMKNGHLSFAIQPGLALGNFLLVLVLTLIAAALPARAASRLEPAQALRTTK